MPTRPLHLMVTFWGVRYRNYFVNLCLPSLLAPGNLSLLNADDGHKFFFATTDDDWRGIQALPIMERLRRHVQPVQVRISSIERNDYTSTIRHEQAAFRMLLDAAYNKAAYGCLLSPDHVASDGMIELLVNHMRDGYRLVLCPNLRQVEDTTLNELAQLGLVSQNPQSSQTAEAIVIPKRVAARLTVEHLHPDLFGFEEGAEIQPTVSPFRYWLSEQGLILHTFFGTPVLMDFSCVPADHTACLDDDHTFESTYLPRNFSDCRKIHVVRDSDEFVLLSLTPSKEAERSSQAARRYRSLCSIRRSYVIYTNRGADRVRGTLSRSVSRWHARDQDDRWFRWEGEITRLLDGAIGDYWRGRESLWRRILYEIAPRIGPSLAARMGLLRYFGRHLFQAISGNVNSRRWVGWALRKYKAAIWRRSFDEPGPQV